jgi:hypothetical protein
MREKLRELASKARPFALGGRGGGGATIADEGDRASVARDMRLTLLLCCVGSPKCDGDLLTGFICWLPKVLKG